MVYNMLSNHQTCKSDSKPSNYCRMQWYGRKWWM